MQNINTTSAHTWAGSCFQHCFRWQISLFFCVLLSYNGKKQIIIDVKGEFVEKFFNKEKDLIICPADIRSAKFNLFELIRTKIDAGVIAEILVAEDKNTQDPHWVNAARAVVEGLLIYAAKNKLSNTDIYK